MIIGADSTDTAVANPFWEFSLALYAQPGVAPACLALQDEHGFDVNLLLFACFAAVRGRRLSDAELGAVDRAVAGWREEVVRPLRRVRRIAVEQEGEANLRQVLLQAELAVERVQQARMWAVHQPAVGGTSAIADCLRENVLRVAALNDVPAESLDLFLALVQGLLPLPAAD